MLFPNMFDEILPQKKTNLDVCWKTNNAVFKEQKETILTCIRETIQLYPVIPTPGFYFMAALEYIFWRDIQTWFKHLREGKSISSYDKIVPISSICVNNLLLKVLKYFQFELVYPQLSATGFCLPFFCLMVEVLISDNFFPLLNGDQVISSASLINQIDWAYIFL